MGTIYGAFSGKPTSQYYPYLVWSVSQSIVGNYSDVTVELWFWKYSFATYSYNLTGPDFTSNIDGSAETTATNFDLRGNQYDFFIKSRTYRVYHNADGSRQCWIGWSGNCETALGTFNFGSTVTLPTIPREASITNSIDFTLGNSIPLTINNAGNMYLKLVFMAGATLGGYSGIGNRTLGQVSSYTLVPSGAEVSAMYGVIPNATSGVILCRIETYSDAGYLVRVGGDKDKTGTMSIDQNANKPTFTTYTIANVDKTIANKDKYNNTLVSSSTHTLVGSVTSRIIKGFSKIRGTILSANKMVALNSATAVKYRFANSTQNAEVNYSTGDVTVDIDNATALATSMTAIDSRNLSTTVNSSFSNLADYSAVNLFNLELTRTNNVDPETTLKFSGTFWKQYFGGGSNGTLNTITAHYRYKETTEAWGVQSWNAITPSSDGSGNITFEDTISGDLGASGFNTEKAYNIEVRIYDKLTNMIVEGVLSTGTPLVDYTKEGVAIKGKYNAGLGGSFQVDDEVFTPEEIRSWLDQRELSDFARQMLINGNFDIWQRGQTFTNPADLSYGIDMWRMRVGAGGGTLPTSIVHSRQNMADSDTIKARAFYRVAPNGTGSSLGVSAYGIIEQYSEQWIRYLKSSGAMKITLTFWARSSIANKKIGVQMYWNYGSGGSPSANEATNGVLFTLTSSWQKFTHTFTIPNFASKTLGTNFDDYGRVRLFYAWGSTSDPSGAGTSENFGGNGTIDFAQVQLSMTDREITFFPRTMQQELLDCKRYYQVLSTYGESSFYSGNVTSGVVYYSQVRYPVEMRTTPIVTFTNTGASGFPTTSGNVQASTPKGVSEGRTANSTTNGAYFHSTVTASAEI